METVRSVSNRGKIYVARSELQEILLSVYAGFRLPSKAYIIHKLKDYIGMIINYWMIILCFMCICQLVSTDIATHFLFLIMLPT